MRNDFVLNGWGQPQGRYVRLIDGDYVLYGAALTGWAVVLVVAIGLVVRARVRRVGVEPTGAIVMGLIGSAGLAATTGVIWLAGRAWISNSLTIDGQIMSQTDVGRGHLLALAAGGIALCCVGLSLAALWHWGGTPTRRPLLRWALAAASIVVACLAVGAAFATYFSIEARAISNEFTPTLFRYAVDGWGRISQSDDFGAASHETRFGIAQAVAAAIVVVGVSILVARGRGWGGWVGDITGTLGHVAVVAISVVEAFVVEYAVTGATEQEEADFRYGTQIGLGSWLLWAAGLISVGWLVTTYWGLLPVWMTKMADLYGSRDGDPDLPDDESPELRPPDESSETSLTVESAPGAPGEPVDPVRHVEPKPPEERDTIAF
jgi:hypothetical protein